MTVVTADISYTYWYRVAGDGRALAQCPTMISRHPPEATVPEMVAQGYEFLKIEAADACARCHGNGRIPVGRRRVLRAYRDCPACKGAAYLNQRLLQGFSPKEVV